MHASYCEYVNELSGFIYSGMKIHQFINSKYLKMTLLRGVTSYIETNGQTNWVRCGTGRGILFAHTSGEFD
jgi:hypothetical protein